MAGRPAHQAPSPSAIAPALLRYVHARGVDASLIAEGDRDATEMAVTPIALAAMLERASNLLGEPHLALGLPVVLPFKKYDALALAARAARSPRAVADLVVRYAPLVFPGLVAEIDATPHELSIRWTVAGHPRGLGIAVDELVLATVFALMTRGLDIAPARVWLTSARSPAIAPIQAALRTREIDFGARSTGFALSVTNADAVLPGADAMLLATATELADRAMATMPRRGAFAEVVTARIESALGKSASPSADEIAALLHMSTRTLQRRLDEEGTRFSDVVDAARERRARELLRDASIPLGEVAYRTGFSDLATFSRAFKRWSGLPPGAFRRRNP